MPSPVPVGHGGVEALLQIDGVSHALLDALTLFDGIATPVRSSRPIAAIELEPTPWAQALLAPLLDAAGYEVRFGPLPPAELSIRLAIEHPGASEGEIALARSADGGPEVARYDRATLADLVAVARKAA